MDTSFFNELKRRNVFRVGLAYLICAWLIMQVADLVLDSINAPDWVIQVMLLLIGLGFIVALIIAWAYELTPDGIKKENDVVRDDSITNITAKKLDVITLVAVAAIVALIGWQQLNPRSGVAFIEQSISADATGAGVTPNPTTNSAAQATVRDASIAVLPFADLSPESDQGYFSDGVSEEILNVLAKINGLRVASRTSAFVYKNSQQRIPEIAGELGVRHILEGSVRRAGETIRVTAQLIDAKTDEHLLSETFDRTLTAENVFAIQGEIAQLIVTALAERIEIAGVATPVVVAADTDNLATLELYYEANALFISRGRENLTRAMNLFERITENDPDFARGWAGLAAVYGVGTSWGLAPRNYYELAKNAANSAIALNPELSTPYAVLANVETNSAEPDWSVVVKNFNVALKLNPDDANLYNWRGLFWEQTGFTERAFADYDKCLTLEPSYINCGYNKYDLLISSGKVNEAAPLHRSLLLKGGTVHATLTSIIQLFADRRDDDALLMALNLLVAESYPDQRWMVKELYEAFTDPDFKHAERLKSFELRRDASIAATGIDRSNSTDRNTILIAFRDFDRAISFDAEPIRLSKFSFHAGITAAQKRQAIISRGLPGFWHDQGFPPQCRPVGTEDFKCDW